MPKIRDFILRSALNVALSDKGRTLDIVRKDYDANWFLRFLQLADEEDWDTGAKIGDAYEKQAWVNIAVSKIAQNLSRAPFEIMEGDDPARPSNPAVKLFSYVNPQLSRYQLWEATTSWLLVRGGCFWIFDEDYAAKSMPENIYLFDPHMFKHYVSPDQRRITMYRFIDREHGIDIPLLPDQLIHFRLWNKKDPFRERNPLFALSTELEQTDLAEKWNTALLRNKSTPPGVLSSERPLSPDQAMVIRETWEKQHKGAERQHRIAVLGSGTKYQNISLTPQELEFMSLKKWNRQTVFSKYGVLPAVAGVKDETSPMSGKDTTEQMQMFWNLTLIPMIKFYEDKLQTDFFERIPELKRTGTTGKFNLDEIPELQEDEEKRVKRIVEQVAAGLLTINEGREMLKREPKPWGETWWAPFNLMPVTSSGEKPEKPEDGNGKMRDVTPTRKLIAKTVYGKAEKLEMLPVYPELFKVAHWEKVIKGWEAIEADFIEAIKGWVFDSRADILAQFVEIWGEGYYTEAIEQMADAGYWSARGEAFGVMAEPYMIRAIEFTEETMNELFVSLGIRVEPSFSIYETGALQRLKFRVTKVKGLVSETMRDQVRGALETTVRDGLSIDEAAVKIRDVFNVGQNRAPMIARTELGGMINDARIESFLSEGFLYHSWLSSRDAKVRMSHAIDGEWVTIGQPFSNGLLYPHEPGGPAEQIINCRCLSLPLKEKPAE